MLSLLKSSHTLSGPSFIRLAQEDEEDIEIFNYSNSDRNCDDNGANDDVNGGEYGHPQTFQYSEIRSKLQCYKRTIIGTSISLILMSISMIVAYFSTDFFDDYKAESKNNPLRAICKDATSNFGSFDLRRPYLAQVVGGYLVHDLKNAL
mmetsp:Transcript_11806/g.17231  ORF Transcript_11806/g.17231 Transcript_11806/m.17231 type:complete len:149 (+) Transcript_11806:140-586(+)